MSPTGCCLKRARHPLAQPSFYMSGKPHSCFLSGDPPLFCADYPPESVVPARSTALGFQSLLCRPAPPSGICPAHTTALGFHHSLLLVLSSTQKSILPPHSNQLVERPPTAPTASSPPSYLTEPEQNCSTLQPDPVRHHGIDPPSTTTTTSPSCSAD